MSICLWGLYFNVFSNWIIFISSLLCVCMCVTSCLWTQGGAVRPALITRPPTLMFLISSWCCCHLNVTVVKWRRCDRVGRLCVCMCVCVFLRVLFSLSCSGMAVLDLLGIAAQWWDKAKHVKVIQSYHLSFSEVRAARQRSMGRIGSLKAFLIVP